jgi:hypothetical protein
VLKKSGFDLPEAGHGFSRAIQSLQINAPLGAEALRAAMTFSAPSLAPECFAPGSLPLAPSEGRCFQRKSQPP